MRPDGEDGTGSEASTQAVETGPFGPIFPDASGNPDAAVARLLLACEGEVRGVLYHPAVGPIDLVWGQEGTGESNGMGLAKIVRWHPEVLDNLQGPLDDMVVRSRSPNRVILESRTHRAVVSLDYFGVPKTWLLTCFAKRTRP